MTSQSWIKAVIQLEKVPYLLTVLFAFIGWGTKHTVDRVLESPVIESYVTAASQGPDKLVTYHLANISRDKLFKNINLSILLTATSSRFLSDPTLKPNQPMSLGRDRPPPEVLKDEVKFSIPEFQPGWNFDIEVRVAPDENPSLLFSSPDQAVKLRKRSWETLLARYELSIILGLTILWLVLAVAYLGILSRAETSQADAQGV